MNDGLTFAQAFAIRGPWVTGFAIDGEIYGSREFVPDGAMERLARDHFPDARTVLELGTLEGGRTAHLAQWARRVVGVDGRAENLNRAAWVLDLLGAANVTLLPACNLEHGLPDAPPCDLVYCVGLLYHLPRPWELVEAMALRCPNLFLWTHVATVGEATETIDGLPYKRYREFGRGDPLSGLSPESLWPTRASLLELLRAAGYAVEVLDEDAHKHGPAITLAARRSSP